MAVDNNLLILSDEIYDRIVYDDTEICSIASFEQVKDRIILANGFSKTYAMTGWRLGYLFADKSVIEAVNRIQQSSTTCPSSFVQMAGITALKEKNSINRMVKEYDKRRRIIVEGLNQIPRIECSVPKGAFYVFPNISRTNQSSSKICNELLEKEGVCTTPGSVFGRYGKQHIRLSYATGIETINKALEKMNRFFSQIT